MRKQYVTPQMMSEEFVANEYVSACFYIACSYAPGIGPAGSSSQWWAQEPYHSLDNDGTGCGHATNQAISVISGDITSEVGATISITELNTKVNGKYEGDKPCYFVEQEGQYNNRKETISGVKNGDEIYWVTDVGYWMPHKGIVTYTDENRPNHS